MLNEKAYWTYRPGAAQIAVWIVAALSAAAGVLWILHQAGAVVTR